MHIYYCLNRFFGYKRRPERYYLFWTGAAASETGDSWRSTENQRDHFPVELLDMGLIRSSDPDLQHHFIWLGNGVREGTVAGIDPQKFSMDLIEFQFQILDPLADNIVGFLGFLQGLRPGIGKPSQRDPAIGIRNGTRGGAMP
ncbi:MAG: hypothetical protein HGA23_12385 [Bacteroidales bacterium]|nr:hypothetical protein [Bacteroidales bacterium]